MALTKKEFLDEHCRCLPGGGVRFCIDVPFPSGGVEALNEIVEDFVEGGHMLQGMSYTPEKLNNDGTIRVSVVADASEIAGVEPDHKCQNCGLMWPRDHLKPVRDVLQRVDPGEPMPSGECPDCGSLCHPDGEDSPAVRWMKVQDDNILLTWVCPTEGCQEVAEIQPSFHQESGNPMCGTCDREMCYLHSEVKLTL